MRNVHKCEVSSGKSNINCSLCDFEASCVMLLNQHLELAHDVCMITEVKNFDSDEEFKAWKRKQEEESESAFVKNCGTKRTKAAEITYYYCHRSGKFKSKGSQKRSLKILGSNKINALCPASMKVVKKNSECGVQVTFMKTHVGHHFGLGRIQLSSAEKIQIAQKLAQKVPVNAILDEIRDSVGNKLDRKHLLTRHDITNIQKEFHINMEDMHSANDAVSVDSWVGSMSHLGKSSPVLFYKRQGDVCKQFPCLQKADFLLVIQNQAQIEMLQIYGNDILCFDATHGTNAYDFELSTVLVLDDKREGFPAAFIVSNRQDEPMYTVAFSCIHEHVDIHPKVFMSDDAEAFYNAFSKIFGHCEKRLLCTWHVDKNWRRNIMKHGLNQEQQASVYKILRSLLVETDEQAFSQMLDNAGDLFLKDDTTKSFGLYFNQNYANRPKAWAYCYRKWSGVNTNMYIERMHRTLKYIYLGGKKVKRLDKSICALMKFVRDKQFDRLISINRGKVSFKLSKLRKHHQCSLSLPEEGVIPNGNSSNTWDVKSATKLGDVYTVQEINKCSKECPLLCRECDACIHNFSCTCIDNSIQWNMCKHIHRVCQFGKINNEACIDVQEEISPDNDNLELGDLVIEENPLMQLRSEEAEMHIDNYEERMKINPVHLKRINWK